MPSLLSNTLLLPGHMPSGTSIFVPLAEISPTSVCGPSLTVIPTLATTRPRPAPGTKRKPARETLQARRPAQRARNATPKGRAPKRQKLLLQDVQTGSEERTELETRNNLVQPSLPPTQEAVEENYCEGITQEDIMKLLPGSQHGHADDIFKRGFWSMRLERDLRLHRWTASDEEALLKSCPIVSAGELYIWRAMPRLFGCELPDLFRYGLGISFYPEAAPDVASKNTEPTAPSVLSGVNAALFPDGAIDGRHDPIVEEFFKALARILPHPVWRGDPSRLRYVLQHAVRARVGPTHVEPLVPPYSKITNNFPGFAWACCRSVPKKSRPCTREERDRELGVSMRWMANMYITADRELSDVVDNLLDLYSHNSLPPQGSGVRQQHKSKVDVRGADAKNVLFDLELCDLQAVYQALENTPQTLDRDPNTHEVIATQLYAATARFFIDDLKTAPDITNGDSREVLAAWVRDQKRAWILSRRREALIRQRMQAQSPWHESNNAHDRPYLLDIPPFDPDGKYQTWPSVTEGQLAVIQGLVTRKVHGSVDRRGEVAK